jgi:uncharacterized membrane protein HdeD (DUF308 family)
MTTATRSASRTSPAFSSRLRVLYFVRFGFAVIWGAVLFLAATSLNPLLTTLVIVYPLVDAAAVLWQLRTEPRTQASRRFEWLNVVVSVLAAGALAVASFNSLGSVLTAWGVWAVVSGITQLIAAVLRRRDGGQVPLIISGALSVGAGISFIVMATHDVPSVAALATYAIPGGVFFLVSAIRLSFLLRRAA